MDSAGKMIENASDIILLMVLGTKLCQHVISLISSVQMVKEKVILLLTYIAASLQAVYGRGYLNLRI